MKKEYQKPSMDVTSLKVENLMGVAISPIDTKDPEEGGDPTGGTGTETDPWTDQDVDIPW